MTKKDSPSLPRSGDFFSDIAQDLQSQVEGLAVPEEAAKTDLEASSIAADEKPQRLDPSPQSSKESIQSQEPVLTPSSDIFDSPSPEAGRSSLYQSPDAPLPTNGLHSAPPPLPISSPQPPEVQETLKTTDGHEDQGRPKPVADLEIEIDLDPPLFSSAKTPVPAAEAGASTPPEEIPQVDPAQDSAFLEASQGGRDQADGPEEDEAPPLTPLPAHEEDGEMAPLTNQGVAQDTAQDTAQGDLDPMQNTGTIAELPVLAPPMDLPRSTSASAAYSPLLPSPFSASMLPPPPPPSLSSVGVSHRSDDDTISEMIDETSLLAEDAPLLEPEDDEDEPPSSSALASAPPLPANQALPPATSPPPSAANVTSPAVPLSPPSSPTGPFPSQRPSSAPGSTPPPTSSSLSSATPAPFSPPAFHDKKTPAVPSMSAPPTPPTPSASPLPSASSSSTLTPLASPAFSAQTSAHIKRTGSQSILRQNPVPCPQCSKLSADPIWCEHCGSALQKPETQPFEPSQKGTTLEADGQSYTLQRDVSRSAERVVWEAQRGETHQSQPYIIEEISVQRYRAGYYRLPDLAGTCIHRPFATLERPDRVFLISSPLAGYRLDRALEEGQVWNVEEIYSIISTIGESLTKVHSFGALFLQLDARQIWMTEEDEPRLLAVERLYNEKTPFHLRPKREGYSAPETYQPRLPISVASDVYSLGLLLHYLISQARPFNHLDTPDPDIPSPRVYHLEFPVGLEHIVRRACHPRPARRYKTIEALLEELDQAVLLIRQRAEAERVPLQLAVGHDIHIGVSKGNRNPVNQDALFWRYDRARGKGLFLVADGVSHCHFGSGDRASSFLIQAARKRWETLLQKPIMEEPLSGDQRRQILSSIFDAANLAIGREINERYERIDGYVEDVMGSTCVAGFLDANEITIGNLGDSRAYLRSLNFLEQITIDHDYKTAQIQAGMDMKAILSLVGGALITRCVGSFRKDEQMKLLPRKLQPDFFDLTLVPGDILLLSSDGLPDYAGANDEEARANVAQILDSYPDPLSACFWLIALANRNGGGDNISVLEIKVLS